MKKLLSVFLCIIVLGAMLTACAPADYAIEWADPQLEHVVREALGKPEGDIMASEMDIITRIHIGFDDSRLHFVDAQGGTLFTYPGEVSDLTAIPADFRHFRKLKQLMIAFSKIKDISALSALTDLEYINLSNNSISDISPLRNLINLKELHLANNKIKDISPLRRLKTLQHLMLAGNSISDISPLGGLIYMWELSLDCNAIRDVSPLANMEHLHDLYLSENDIRDISPLIKLTKLRRLDLVGMDIDAADIASLRESLPGCAVNY